jgi:hypothetical protein
MYTILWFFLFPWRKSPLVWQGLNFMESSMLYSDTPHSVGFLWSAQRRNVFLTTHTSRDIFAPGGIRTRNSSNRVAKEPRYRPHSPCDRHTKYKEWEDITSVANSFNQTNWDICPICFALINRQTSDSAMHLGYPRIILTPRPEFNARLFLRKVWCTMCHGGRLFSKYFSECSTSSFYPSLTPYSRQLTESLNEILI